MKREWLAFLSAVQFLTRLPVPDPSWEAGRLDRAAKWFPLVGALVGLCSGMFLFGVISLAFRGLPVLELTVLFGVLITGALHEDGLADTADGFYGGRTTEKRLSIMRDSRIGTYGVIALVFALLLRISLYEGYFSPLISSASYAATMVATFMAAQTVSRALILVHVSALPYAREGATPPLSGATKGGIITCAVTTLIVCIPVAKFISFGAVVAGMAVATASALAFTRLSRKRIGGWTGDTAGSTQVISELSFMIGFSAWIWS